MKIGISSTGKNLNSRVDSRFGRCEYFLIIDSDTMKFECINNEGLMVSGGAGIRAAENIANKGVDIVITGNIGPNAFQTLSAAKIKVFTGAEGIIKDVIEKYKRGELKQTNNPNVGSHFGMGK